MLKYVIIFVLAIGIGAIWFGLYALYTFSSLPDNPVWKLILKKEFKVALVYYRAKKFAEKMDKMAFEFELKLIKTEALDYSDNRYKNIGRLQRLSNDYIHLRAQSKKNYEFLKRYAHNV